MADAHGRSVFETNKVNNCLVLNIYVFPHVQGIFLVKHTQSKFLKTQRFIFISYSADFTGVLAGEQKCSGAW